MKKICFLYVFAAVFALLFTSCQFFQVGYWQQMAEKLGSQAKVQSMPDYSSKYTWDEISLERAQLLWETQAYRTSLRNPPQSVAVYQKDSDGITKYSDCKIEKFPNYLYSKEIAEYIYVYAFASIYMYNNYARLNYYIPSTLPEGTKIYEARGNSDYVRMEIPLDGQEKDESLPEAGASGDVEAGGDEADSAGTEAEKKATANSVNNVIFKKGLMIQFDMGYPTFIEY